MSRQFSGGEVGDGGRARIGMVTIVRNMSHTLQTLYTVHKVGLEIAHTYFVMKSHEGTVTCIPVSRDAPRDETNHRHFEFN
jgi:hypothetical protein